MFLKMRNRLPRLLRCMSSDGPEVKEMAVKIVRDYLTGHWKMANSNNVIVQKVSGGLSNRLYQITLSLYENQDDTTNPKTVLLRIYGQIPGKSSFEHVIKDSLIFMLMSERNLGPKLHGVFPGGQIEEYIPARALKTTELRDPKISQAIATKIAQVHTLEVPILKNADFLFNKMFNWLEELQKNWEKYVPNDSQLQKLAEKFKSFDLASEVTWLRNYLEKFNWPVVFCHNDVHEGNLLIPYDSVNSEEPNLVLIDYEFCSYNYRGFDFANHFLEHTVTYISEYPYYIVDSSVYPSTEEQVKFIRNYLKVYHKLTETANGCDNTKRELKETTDFNEGTINTTRKDITEEEAQLLKEISNFRLLSHLFWGIWGAAQSQCGIEFAYWEYCLTRLEAYFKTKEEILGNEIPKVKIKS